MSTRSDIIVRCADGKWARIYCHSDGYLEHNGRILFDHYTSQAQADALVALGDLSCLGEVLGEKHPFDNPHKHGEPSWGAWHDKYKSWCLAYGRDRGETGTETSIHDSLQAAWPDDESWTEFTYVWNDGRWWVGDPDEGSQTLIDLGDALLGKKSLRTAVKAFGCVIGQHQPTKPGKDHGWTQGRLI